MAGLANSPPFQDFDDKEVYEQCARALLQADTKNFTIEFNCTAAKCALNLDEVSIEEVLKSEPRQSTRWINVWGPERQQGFVKALSRRYAFSPRLLGIMCSEHNKPTPVPSLSHNNARFLDKMHITAHRISMETPSSDPEKNGDGIAAVIPQHMLDLSHYKVVNEVWHYCSVDWGEKYLCVGYNSLSDTTAIFADSSADAAHLDSEGTDHARNKPKGARTWTWLVLCNDGTVISIYENPFPNRKGPLNQKEQLLLKAIRRNLLNVFMQLSTVNDNYRAENPIMTLDIRPGLTSDRSSSAMSKIKIEDSPSLLFYYLFDDWYTSYALVAKNEHQYARQLETLREDMFAKPQVPLIDQLHQYGRELAVLKRMYQSYALIIERILGRQMPAKPATVKRSKARGRHARKLVPDSNTTMQIRDESPRPDDDVTAEPQTLAAPLSSAATVRFERLLDRINLFALSEIQECLDEKESLVFLNFNLLAMKESQAVERLTRVTILLAKMTILFMPVSLMTAYFSTQLTGLADKYTIKAYWICFAVIMALSLLFLTIFGWVSGTLEGKPIYRTLTQTVLDIGRGKWDTRKGRNRHMKREA